jgi:hypothetical protein
MFFYKILLFSEEFSAKKAGHFYQVEQPLLKGNKFFYQYYGISNDVIPSHPDLSLVNKAADKTDKGGHWCFQQKT